MGTRAAVMKLSIYAPKKSRQAQCQPEHPAGPGTNNRTTEKKTGAKFQAAEQPSRHREHACIPDEIP